jgi:hypothetical protein
LIEHLASDWLSKVGADLGHFWAEFGHEPKRKVAAHKEIYNLYLRCTSIRAMD